MWDNLLPIDRPNSQSFGRYVNRASSWSKLPPNLFLHLIKFHLVGAVSSHILSRMILKSSLFSNMTWVELRQQKSKDNTVFVWWWRWGILLWWWTGGTKKILATFTSSFGKWFTEANKSLTLNQQTMFTFPFTKFPHSER